MSSESAYLALMLDAPMQSWGFSSRFQRRTTGLHPTKSGIIGMICAALGLDKHVVGPDLVSVPSGEAATTQGRALREGKETEKEMLPKLAELKMTTIMIPRRNPNRWKEEPLPVLRLEDYHTVQGSRKASDPTGRKADAEATVLTHRQYLLDARFGVILAGDKALLEKVKEALEDPVWGIWFGRKNCIPAEPVCRGLFVESGGGPAASRAAFDEAVRGLVGDKPLDQFTRIEESDFSGGNDTWSDGVPESFNAMRPWPVRRINQQIADRL